MSNEIYKILVALKNKGEDITEQLNTFYALKKSLKNSMKN